jgi:hypothetical protein
VRWIIWRPVFNFGIEILLESANDRQKYSCISDYRMKDNWSTGVGVDVVECFERHLDTMRTSMLEHDNQI